MFAGGPVTLDAASAGARFDQMTLNTGVFEMVVTNDRRAAARTWLDAWRAGKLPYWEADADLTEDELLDSPYLAFGTHQEIASHVERVREMTGMSYFMVFPHLIEEFGRVIELIKR